MDNLRGSFLMVLAMLGFAIEDMFIKLAAETIPVGQILLTVGVSGTVVFGLTALLMGQPPIRRDMLRGASGLRAVFEGIAALCFVTALALAPISIITMIIQANPLLVTLGAAVIFRETVGPRRWAAIAIGLFGVLLVLRPFGEAFEVSALFAVAGVIANSARDLATRAVTATTSTVQLSTLGFLSAIPAGLLSLIFTGDPLVWPDPLGWLWLLGTILIGIPALYCIIAAMRVGEMSYVAPFRYSRILFGLVIGVAVFGESLDALAVMGAAIIVASGLYTFWREARLSAASKPADPAV